MKTHPLKDYFDDLTDVDLNDRDSCIRYLRHKFKAKWIGENITFNVTCALDQSQMAAIIADIEKDFVGKILAQNGLYGQ